MSGVPPTGRLLSANALVKTFRSGPETVTAVDGVDLVGRAGELICILGASGSGKSTLLGLLAGLDLPDSGTVEIDRVRVDDLDEAGRARLRLTTVGMVFQEHQLVDEFTAAENVALPLEVNGTPATAARDQALRRLGAVGLGSHGDRLPRELSGGQRQRVGIARALAGDRRVLLADEPTGALDTTRSRMIFRLLRELADGGVLVVVCTHDLDCTAYADRVHEISDGRLRVLDRVRSR